MLGLRHKRNYVMNPGGGRWSATVAHRLLSGLSVQRTLKTEYAAKGAWLPTGGRELQKDKVQLFNYWKEHKNKKQIQFTK